MTALGGGMTIQGVSHLGVLVVEEAERERERIRRFLATVGFDPVVVGNAQDALKAAKDSEVSVAIISHRRTSGQGLELVRELRRANPGMEAVLLTSDRSPELATEAFRVGVFVCLNRPVDLPQLSQTLNTLREAVRERMQQGVWEGAPAVSASVRGMVGTSAPMQAVFAAIRRFGREEGPVLITGLIGTGKGLAARALHALSPRSGDPLVMYRCCGVSEPRAETELFGASRPGAAAGGQRHRQHELEPAVLHSARGGTLLLDEVGDLPIALQARLAEELKKELETEPGQPPSEPSGIRWMATTRLNLAEHAARGRFNPDLYQLLCRNVIHLPSLGERQQDIPLLSRHFQEIYNLEFGKRTRRFSAAAERVLLRYSWPGNVRELKNVIGRACLLAEGDCIAQQDLSIAAAEHADEWGQKRGSEVHKRKTTRNSWEAQAKGPVLGQETLAPAQEATFREKSGRRGSDAPGSEEDDF